MYCIYFYIFLNDLEMPLDKSPVIDKSVFPLGVTCVAVALGNASILRSRVNLFLGNLLSFSPASWRSGAFFLLSQFGLVMPPSSSKASPQWGFMSP